MKFGLYNILISFSALAVGCSQAPAPEPEAYKTSADQSSPNGQDQLPGKNNQNSGDNQPDSGNTSKAPTESECVGTGFYFDLVTNECTKRKLVKVTCNLDNITNPAGSDYLTLNAGAKSDFLADNQKSQVKLLFDGALAGYTLRYCVDDNDQYTLVAVKNQNGQNLVQDIDVPK